MICFSFEMVSSDMALCSRGRQRQDFVHAVVLASWCEKPLALLLRCGSLWEQNVVETEWKLSLLVGQSWCTSEMQECLLWVHLCSEVP